MKPQDHWHSIVLGAENAPSVDLTYRLKLSRRRKRDSNPRCLSRMSSVSLAVGEVPDRPNGAVAKSVVPVTGGPTVRIPVARHIIIYVTGFFSPFTKTIH